jgi:O-antigen biosynthesis protein
MRVRSHLERVQEQGLVSGWCWDESHPSRAVSLIILVDGEPVGTTVADTFRADLEQAGIGNGSHAFSYLLPWDRIAAKSVTTISLVDESSGESLDSSVIFRRAIVQPVEERLHDLERQIRLLTARLDDVAQQAQRDAATMSGVFFTIGQFFTRLSEIAPDAAPTEFVTSLPRLLEHTQASLAPITLELAAEPVMTVCVHAAGTLQGIYGCLLAIHVAGLDAEAEIVLIDDGSSDHAVLIPALVQNLRYWRLQPGQSLLDARNRIISTSARKFVAFFSAATRVTSDWLPQTLSTFEDWPQCAIVGAKVVRLDDTIEVSGLLPDRAGRLSDFGYAEHALTPRCDRLAPVAAVVDVAIAMRGDIFAELGGFDTSFARPRGAAIDLCIRSWDKGYSVLYQPSCPLRWSDEGRHASMTHNVLDPDTAQILASRWKASPRHAWPSTIGRALLLDGPWDQQDAALPDLLQTAHALQGIGYSLTFGVPGALDAEGPRGSALRNMGVEVLRPPFFSSVVDAIQSRAEKYDLIYVAGGACAEISLEDLHVLTPESKIILALDAEAEAAAALLSKSVAGKARASRLLADVASSDYVLTKTETHVASLRKLTKGKVRRLEDRPRLGHVERSGIWLAFRPHDAASWQWFRRSLLPHILRRLPGVRIHAARGSGVDTDAFSEAIWHEPHEVLQVLRTMRLAVAPQRQEDGESADVMACIEEGLPVVGTVEAFPSKVPIPGLVLVRANAQEMVRQVVAIYKHEAEWRLIADEIKAENLRISPGVLNRRLMESYREVIHQLGLPLA